MSCDSRSCGAQALSGGRSGVGVGWVYRRRPYGVCGVGEWVGGPAVGCVVGGGMLWWPPGHPAWPSGCSLPSPSLSRCQGLAVVCTSAPLGVGPTAAQACRLGPGPWASLAFLSQCPLPLGPIGHLPCQPPHWAAWTPAGP